ncbi:helix-turn-helix domain-containing protein [Streptomyces sp. NPDC006700]|uniref:helix-turn-helix transcriptional regulator n=1 Tax=Streptomyces sp. NPDC006700 TaxID=3154479 RepID=UPI0033FA144F
MPSRTPDAVAGPAWVPPAGIPPLSSRMMRATWRGLPAKRHEAGWEPGLLVPAADGSPLITDHYFPRAQGDFPTLLVRSPYGRGLPWSPEYGLLFAEQGFHVILQSCRGTGGSGGRFDLWRNEAADGRATVLRTWYQDHAPRGSGGWAAALADPAVGAALQHMHAEPATAWTVERLSRRAGLSRAAYSRRFTELVGRPPMTYLSWWRMTTAGRILRSDADAPLQTVAERVGYRSEFAFNRAFKREFGISPGAYRRQGAGSQNRRPTPRPGVGRE